VIHQGYGTVTSEYLPARIDFSFDSCEDTYMENTLRQPTVRTINEHLFGGSHYCYIDMPDGRRFRIARARTRKGVVEGRIILGSEKDWEPITGGRVELS
jgi:hypothetical protein